jgi:hypothetical protein
MWKQMLGRPAVVLVVFLVSSACWEIQSRRDVVRNSLWDGSVAQVRFFLEHNWKDLGCEPPIRWGKVVKTLDGNFLVPCSFHQVRPDKGTLEVLFTFGPDGQFVAEKHAFTRAAPDEAIPGGPTLD